MNYACLDKRMTELHRLYDATHDVRYAIEDDSICSFLGCDGSKRYEKVLAFAKNHNFNRIYDIGCAFGHQSEVFKNSSVSYVGINDTALEFWNKDVFNYVVGTYPINLNTCEDDLAVSILCLTWGCYLYDGDVTVQKQCEQLRKDFKHCLLYISEDKINVVAQYFTYHTLLENGLVYFNN